MSMPLVFAYYSAFTLRIIQPDLLFRAAKSECCVRTIMTFLLSALIDSPSRIWEAFCDVFCLYWKALYSRILFAFVNLMMLLDSSR